MPPRDQPRQLSPPDSARLARLDLAAFGDLLMWGARPLTATSASQPGSPRNSSRS